MSVYTGQVTSTASNQVGSVRNEDERIYTLDWIGWIRLVCRWSMSLIYFCVSLSKMPERERESDRPKSHTAIYKDVQYIWRRRDGEKEPETRGWTKLSDRFVIFKWELRAIASVRLLMSLLHPLCSAQQEQLKQTPCECHNYTHPFLSRLGPFDWLSINTVNASQIVIKYCNMWINLLYVTIVDHFKLKYRRK